jgi:ribonuclease P/MRP protein subunit RPP1
VPILLVNTVGYSTIAFNTVVPINGFDSATISGYNPCYDHQPVFPELGTRNADTSKGQQAVLQLSRLTVMLDERSMNGGKGNGIMFVR